MKKRILAFALTLAMVITSLSMLSFVSFAEDGTDAETPDVVAKDFYAYRGTMTVDSKLGVDELWVAVNKEIAPGVAVGMSWDYDNVYIAVYNEPTTNGEAGARADYIESFKFNIGGAVISGNLTEDTKTAPAGVKVVLGYTGEGNPRCVIEASVPLSSISLDKAKLAEGILSVPTTLVVNQVYADATTPVTTANLNVILSGRSLAYQADRTNPSGTNANGHAMFMNGHVYRRVGTTGLAAGYVNSTDDFKNTSVYSGGQGTSNSPLVVIDKMIDSGGIEFVRNGIDYSSITSLENGGQNYYEFQFNIKNLPVNGTMTNVDDATTFKNTSSYILVNCIGHGSTSKGTRVNLWNAGGEAGLSVYYPSASGNKSVSLGVEEGEQFWLGFNEISTGKIEIYVNDVCIVDDMIAESSNVTSDKGYVWIASHRGKSGIGLAGYSLDLNQDNVVDDEECISFTVADSVLCSVAPVDVATVASLTRTGGTPTSTVVNTYADINVASLTTASVTYDVPNKVINVSVEYANIDSFTVSMGSFEATATLGLDKNPRPDAITVALDDASKEAGATAKVGSGSITVSLPMDKMYTWYDAAGNVVTDIEIYVEKSDAATDKEGRVNCVTDGSFKGTVVFTPEVTKYIMAPVVLNTAGAAAANGDKNTIFGGGVGTANYGKIIYTQAEGQTRTPDCYYTNLGSAYNAYGSRITYMDIKIDDMTPVDVSTVTFNNGIAAVQAYEKINLHFGTNYDQGGSVAGATLFNLVNTTNGGTDGGESLVVAYYNLAENKNYVIPLDRTVGETFRFEFVWDAPTHGYLKIDDKVILEKDDIRSYANMKHITGQPNGGQYFRVVRGSGTGTAAFNFTIENLTLATKTLAVNPLDAISKIFEATKKLGSIDLSYVQESNVVNNAYSIRLLALIDTLEASKAGFEVSIKDDETEATAYATTTVYDSVWQNLEAGRTLLEAPEGKNFVAITIPLIEATAAAEAGAEATDVTVTFVVKPYFVSGSYRVYGAAYEITYTGGEFVSAIAVD